MSIPDPYEEYDAVGLADLVAKGEVSPQELLGAAVARLEARNPEINAVVVPMLDEARAAIAAGLPEGRLCGVPFLLKDLNLLTTGVRTTNGSRLFEDYVADHDSELVTRYRRAGLVIFGKTHSPELGLTTSTESRLFGQTRNPWKLTHMAGGSSGGSAAAVAAGIVPSAHSSDGGGSIRIPASCCGLFGLKPTRARIPMGPDAGEGWGGLSTSHAITRSVRDCAALLDVSHGPEVGAPYYAPAREGSFLDEVGAAPGRLRIALQTQTFNGADVDSECAAAAEDAADLCRDLGHDVREAQLPIDSQKLGRATLTVIAANTRCSLEDRAAILGRELREDDVEPGTWAMTRAADPASATDYARAIRVIHAAARRVAVFLKDYDLLLTPTMATPPLELGRISLSNPDQQGNLRDLMRTTAYTQLFNVSGSPAMSVPLTWSRDGLPIGVQFAGRFGDEATLLRLAAQLEEARPWRHRRPPA